MSTTNGGIQQLVYNTGLQDKFLTGNPKHNFIKQSYKQYHNFAIENIKIPYIGSGDFGHQMVYTIKKTADFLKSVHFSFTLPILSRSSGTYAGWTNGIGYAIIDTVDIKINDLKIDTLYGLFLAIYNELTNTQDKSNVLTGTFESVNSLQYNALQETEYKVEIPFWFSQNIACALPLLSLSRTNSVEIVVKLNTFDKCIVYDGNTPPVEVKIKDAYLSTDQIFVDDSFKKLFKGQKQVYVIKQHQYFRNDIIGNLAKFKLDFNHPVSQLVFVLREQLSEENNDHFNFSIRNTNITHQLVSPLLSRTRLLMDGKPRNDYQTSQELSILNAQKYYKTNIDKHIYTIPFCNDPLIWYPNGALNFSLIQSCELQLETTEDCNLYMFGVNWNFITIDNSFVKIEFDS